MPKGIGYGPAALKKLEKMESAVKKKMSGKKKPKKSADKKKGAK